VLDGIKSAEKAGFASLKITSSCKKASTIRRFLNWSNILKTPNIRLRFIEYMDVGNCNHWQEEYVVPTQEIIETINQFTPLEAIDANYYGEVAQRYRFKDGSGEIGFISSVSVPFCSSCTRLRLSTDGKLYTCLFATEGTDIKTLFKMAPPITNF